jgi:opacity protein-like surface antigen
MLKIKSLVLGATMFALAIGNAMAQSDTLNKEAPYTNSKTDIQLFMKLVVENDTQAFNEMLGEGRLGINDQDKPITLLDLGFMGTDHYVSFRFKGSTHVYWTMRSGVAGLKSSND